MTGRYISQAVARRDSWLQDGAVCSVSAGCAPLVTGNVSPACHTCFSCHVSRVQVVLGVLLLLSAVTGDGKYWWMGDGTAAFNDNKLGGNNNNNNFQQQNNQNRQQQGE